MRSTGQAAQPCLLPALRTGVFVHVCKMFYLKMFVVNVNILNSSSVTLFLYLSILMFNVIIIL
jgi:hypothetical protein